MRKLRTGKEKEENEMKYEEERKESMRRDKHGITKTVWGAGIGELN